MTQVTKVDHFAEAERVITVAMSYINDQKAYGEFAGWTRAELLALAQVHASLAEACEEHREADAEEALSGCVSEANRIKVSAVPA